MSNNHNDRQFKEEQIIRKAIGEKLTKGQLDYFNNHPAIKGESYPPYLMQHLSNHSAFKDENFKTGKIIVQIDN